jgi:IstB-like ATP binding protein
MSQMGQSRHFDREAAPSGLPRSTDIVRPPRHRSTIVTSQLPVDQWHALIGDPTYADAVLDRLVHNAHRIDLNGESLRRTRKPGRKA